MLTILNESEVFNEQHNLSEEHIIMIGSGLPSMGNVICLDSIDDIKGYQLENVTVIICDVGPSEYMRMRGVILERREKFWSKGVYCETT